MSQPLWRVPRRLRSPVLTLVAAARARRKYGPDYERVFEFLTHSTAAERDARAAEELESFLRRVRREVPRYEVPASLDVREMPIVDKGFVRAHHADLCLDPPFFVGKSSGTTGEPLKVPYNRAAYQREYAFWQHHRHWGGVERGQRFASFAGHQVVPIDRRRPPFWLHNRWEHQLLFSSYHLAEAHLDAIVDRLERFAPAYMHGYPSSLHVVARHILATGRRLSWQPRMIAGASETTLPFQRRDIEAAFGCKYYVWYGNTEFAGHVEECPEGRLHVQTYHSLLRVVGPDGRDVGPGEQGEIVATNYTNTSLALINYNTHDVARVAEEQTCPCGHGGLLLDHILGRVEDYVLTRDGRKVGRLDHLFKDAKYVRRAQIEQREVGAIVVRVEREPGYDRAVEDTVRAEAHARLGRDFDVAFEYVDDIPRTASGKHRFVVQHLDAARLDA